MPIPDGVIRMDGADAVLLKLRIHPGAKRSGINGFFGNSLKVDLQAPPVDGKANAALLKFIAGWLKMPRSAIELKSGDFSRDKIIKITGTTPEKIISVLSIES